MQLATLTRFVRSVSGRNVVSATIVENPEDLDKPPAPLEKVQEATSADGGGAKKEGGDGKDKDGGDDDSKSSKDEAAEEEDADEEFMAASTTAAFPFRPIVSLW